MRLIPATKVYVLESPSESSSEEEEPSPPPVRQPKKKRKSKQRQRVPSALEWDMKDTYNHQMNLAFSSLFPNYNV